MSKHRWIDWATLGVILLLAVFYGWTLMDIPFHPDESTHIYMSSDFSKLFSDPLGLSWEGSPPLDNEERIRAIDAPLAKYIIGLIREIFSIPPLDSDWDWSLSWEENRSAGALPSARQLLFSRAAITAMLPISLWIYYLALKKILPAIPSLAAVTLLGLNPLLLLHGRRAMSEGILICGIALFLWSITRDKRNPWLIGLALGFAINAKHSALGLLPAAFLAVCLLPDQNPDLKKTALNILKISLVIVITSLLLNPFYWKQPIAALNTGLKARFSLAKEQQEDHLIQPGKLRTTIPGLILHTYFTSPQTEETGNYLIETQDVRESYLATPLHSWGRDKLSGSILLTLTLAGIGYVFWAFSDKEPAERNIFLIVALATLGISGFAVFLLPWQRYIMPLLPFTFCWVAAGLTPFIKSITKGLTPEAPE
jgi:hypothetical protein